MGRLVLAGNQDWACLPPYPTHPYHPTLLAEPRNYFILHPFGNYVARGIAMFMFFDLVILFLEINNNVYGYIYVIIIFNVIN